MQKIYSIALAALTSISVAAAPATSLITSSTSLMKDVKAPLRLQHSVNTDVKKKAPATRAEDATWSEWEMAGTGTFTLDDGLPAFLGLEEWTGSFEGINVYSRENTQTPTSMQYKLEGVYNNADIIVDYDAVTGLCFVQPQPTNIEAFDCPLDVADVGTLFRLYGAEWEDMSEEEAQELADEYGSYNYFIPEMGKFYLYLAYITDGIEQLLAVTDCIFQFDGAADTSVSVEANDFYKEADNIKALVKFSKDVAYCKYGCFEGVMTQNMINNLLIGNGDIKTISEAGMVDLECAEGPGMYTILAISYAANGTPLEMGYAEFTYTPSSSEGWTALGTGTYTSDMMESLFGEPSQTYSVEVERNDANPALIRIVNPYANYVIDQFTSRVEGYDLYLVFDTTDPERVFFKPTNLGLDYGGGWWIACNAGYFIEVLQGKTANKTQFGKLENDVISFPSKSVLVTCENMSIFGGEDNTWYYGNGSGNLSLVIPNTSAVDNVSVEEVSAPEYFNLQGSKIAAPAKGSVVIERCGSTVTKKMIR